MPPTDSVAFYMCADPYWLNVLNESLQGRHPAGCKVTVLEEHPLTALHSCVHHGFSPGALNRSTKYVKTKLCRKQGNKIIAPPVQRQQKRNYLMVLKIILPVLPVVGGVSQVILASLICSENDRGYPDFILFFLLNMFLLFYYLFFFYLNMFNV